MQGTPVKALSRKRRGRWWLLLFGLPFAAVGTVTGYFIVNDFYNSIVMSSWLPVPAIIESVNLESKRGRKSKNYRVVAQYRYEISGANYTGERVSLYSSPDNIGSFHKDTYEKLKTAHSSNLSVDCYVNPKNHSESVLFPNVRWGMIGFYLVFTLTFGLVGYALIFVALCPWCVPTFPIFRKLFQK
jgi:hypothetical protein